MQKLPWYKWHPKDVLTDTELNSCTMAAQGFWRKVLDFMYLSQEPGTYHLNMEARKVILDVNLKGYGEGWGEGWAKVGGRLLASVIGCTENDAIEWLCELYKSGVFYFHPSGIIVNRRMFRDWKEYEKQEEIKRKRAEGGKLGGNPLLLKTKKKEKDNQEVNHSSDSDSLSDSISEGEKEKSLRKEREDSAKNVIAYLNKKTGKKFKPVTANLKPILGRLADSYTPDEIRRVIDLKTSQWLHNPDMARYLRPETLFSPSKFDGYLNELGPRAARPMNDFDQAVWDKADSKARGDYAGVLIKTHFPVENHSKKVVTWIPREAETPDGCIEVFDKTNHIKTGYAWA